MSGRAGTKRIWFALVTVYLVWGSTYLAIAAAVETLPPFLKAGSRFLIAGAVLLPWAARRGDRGNDPIGWRQWGAAALIGAFLLLAGNGGVSWAEQEVPSGAAALIIGSTPLWMVLFAILRKEERITGRVWAGMVLGFLGIALLVGGGEGSEGSSYDPVGIAVLFGAAISWAFGSVLALRVPLPRSAAMATAMEMLTGGALLAIVGLAIGELRGFDPAEVSLESVLGWLYLIVFGSFAGFGAYVWLLKNAPPSLVSTYAYVNPVVAVFLGWAIRDEPVTLVTLVAAGLIVVAVALIVVRRSRSKPVEAPASREAAPTTGAEDVRRHPAVE